MQVPDAVVEAFHLHRAHGPATGHGCERCRRDLGAAYPEIRAQVIAEVTASLRRAGAAYKGPGGYSHVRQGYDNAAEFIDALERVNSR